MLTQEWRVAIVEDEKPVRARLKSLLEARGWLVDVFVDVETALPEVVGKPYHLLITALRLPDGSGLSLARRLRECHQPTETILLAGEVSSDDAIEAISLRTFACLRKPLDEEAFLVEVDKAREIIALRRDNEHLVQRFIAYERTTEERIQQATRNLAAANRQLAEANRELTALAVTDPLTELANYRAFRDRLAGELDRSRRHGLQFAVVMVDADHFKSYNDTHGHLAGNQALVQLANLMRQHVRNHDVAARVGGEEFAILLVACDVERADASCERLRAAVAAATFCGRDGARASLSVSAGYAIYPGDGTTSEELLEKADRALYVAKRTGRGRVVGWGQALSSELYRGEPKVDLPGPEPIAAEASRVAPGLELASEHS